MLRGRKPKPTARKRLDGNPGGRPLNDREPQMPAASDELPPELVDGDPIARAEWLRLSPLLRQARVLTAADRAALVALCQQWARYLDADKRVAAAGMVVKAPRSGYPMPNPYIGIANRALGNCVRLWSELGLTPSSRTRLHADGDGPPIGGDAFSEFDPPPFDDPEPTH